MEHIKIATFLLFFILAITIAIFGFGILAVGWTILGLSSIPIGGVIFIAGVAAASWSLEKGTSYD